MEKLIKCMKSFKCFLLSYITLVTMMLSLTAEWSLCPLNKSCLTWSYGTLNMLTLCWSACVHANLRQSVWAEGWGGSMLCPEGPSGTPWSSQYPREVTHCCNMANEKLEIREVSHTKTATTIHKKTDWDNADTNTGARKKSILNMVIKILWQRYRMEAEYLIF